MLRFLYIPIIFISVLLTSCSQDEVISDAENCDREVVSRMTIYEFPDIYTIGMSKTVGDAAMAAWKETLASHNLYARREIGFYIYYDRDNNDYIIGEFIYGPMVPYSEGNAYMVFGEVTFPYKLCAFFHCHPPYMGVPGRKTGPSEADLEAAQKLGVPGVVYDYSPEYVDMYHIYEADGPVPYVFGPLKRGDLIFY